MAKAEKTGMQRVTINTSKVTNFKTAEQAFEPGLPGVEMETQPPNCPPSQRTGVQQEGLICPDWPGSPISQPAFQVKGWHYSVRLINTSFPGNGLASSCRTHSSKHLKHLLNTPRGLNRNLIFLAKQWCVQQANRITCLILPSHTYSA